jgi:hypothetical protein
MSEHATYDDVNLILRLYDLRREEKFRKARDWFAWSFKVRTVDELNALCPLGSDENAYYRMVISYWEMVASFITSEVLKPDLFFQSGREMLFVWERISDLVPQLRETSKDPASFRNMEKVASLYIQWMKNNALDSYSAFSARVKGI